MIDSILKIITPWITRENEQKKADEEKFLELLNILKPEEINSWCDDLWNASYRSEKNIQMDNYFDFINKPDSYFFRKKLTKDYELFNKKFSELRNFLLVNFFVNRNNMDFVELCFEKISDYLYRNKIENLKKLVSEFQESYNKFVVCGKEKYIGKFTTIISLLLLTTVVTPGIIWIIQKIILHFRFN